MLTVMLPLAFEQVKYIPIPRIEHEDANYYFVAEDIVLSSVNFLPNMMEIKVGFFCNPTRLGMTLI